MLALTVWQPYATLIVEGIKTQEFRLWLPNHFGKIFVHAGKPLSTPHTRHIAQHYLHRDISQLPTNAIIGQVRIHHAFDHNALDADQAKFGWPAFPPLPYVWNLIYPDAFPDPTPCKGHPLLWQPHPDILAEIDHNLRPSQHTF